MSNDTQSSSPFQPDAAFWQRKLAALDIRSHEERAAKAYVRSGLPPQDALPPEARFDKAADWTAAAADRVPFPRSQSSGLTCAFDGMNNQFHHPLGGASFRMHAPFPSEFFAEEVEQLLQPAAPATPDDWDNAQKALANFFAHWRLWLPYASQKDARFAFLPADTRIPDHTIFQHTAVTAAFAGCGGAPALLRFHLGPVQSFIAAARSTRDLWSGSFLLSWLITTGLKKLTMSTGPDAVIFPNLHGQPLFDLLWRDELWDRLKSADAVQNTIWDTFGYSTTELTTPNFPNVFLALVPAANAADLAREVEKAIRNEWHKIAEAVWKFAFPDKEQSDRFKRQIARHLALSWQVTPFPKTLDEAEQVATALPDKSLLERFKNLRKTFEHDLPPEHRDSRFYTDAPKTKLNNIGLAWPLLVALNAWQLDATRQTRAFAGIPGGWAIAENSSHKKDALNGIEEEIPLAGLSDDSKKFFKHNDPVGATTLVKRLWHEAYLKKFPGLENAAFAMPNTHSLAKCQPDANDETDGDNDPDDGGKYFAILAFDGDDMGKWVSGEKTPPYRDQLADYKDAQSRTDKGAVEYFTRINATEFLNTQRLLTPSYHLQFSESLSNFALHIAPRIVRAHKGRLIYAGGDDVLAMLPASNALACAHDLQMAFSGKAPMKECGIRELSPGFLAIDHRSGRDQLGKLIPFIVPGPRATASVGIAMAHFKAPLQDVVRAAQAAEKRAKKHCPEKNAFAVSVFKHSGEISEWDGTFRNAAALAAFSDLLRLMNEEVLSSKFPHKFLELIEPYRSTGSIQDCADFNFTEAVKHDLDLVIERQRGPDYTAKSGGEIRATMNAYLKTLTGSPTERHRQLSGLLTVAAFLARQPQ